MHESCHNLIHLVYEFQDSFIAWIWHPPMFMTPNCCPQPLRPAILKLEPLDHLHVGQVGIRYRRPSPVYIKSSLRQWLIEALVAFARGDDDMRLAVHEAAGLVGPDLATGGKGRVVGSGLGRMVAESE